MSVATSSVRITSNMNQYEPSCSHSSSKFPCPRSFDEYKQTVFEKFSPLFFNAIAHWTQFQSEEITKNRIQVLEQFSMLLQFLRRSENREKEFSFYIKFERHEDTRDCQQTRQEQTGDLLLNVYDYFSQTSLTEDQNKIIERLSEQSTMAKVYNYMHDLLLQPLYVLWKSGLSTANNQTQPLIILFSTFQNLIQTYSKLFLFSESSGLLSVHLQVVGGPAVDNKSTRVEPVFHALRLSPLSTEGQKLFEFIRHLDRRSPVSSSLKTSSDTSLPLKKRKIETSQPSSAPFHEISSVSLRSFVKERDELSSGDENDIISASSYSSFAGGSREKRRCLPASPSFKTGTTRNTRSSKSSNSSDDKVSALSRKRKSINEEEEELHDEEFWTSLHPAINTRVAKMDEVHAKKILQASSNSVRGKRKKGKEKSKNTSDDDVGCAEDHDQTAEEENTARLQRGIVMGEVIQYSPTSSHRASQRRNESSNGDKTEEVEEGEGEGRYRILWENDEVSVMNQAEMENGLKFYNDYYGWKVAGHESIGSNVAKYFYLPGIRGAKKAENHKKVFFGRVTKYAPPEEVSDEAEEAEKAEDLHRGELFHICWEDGDQEDLDFFEYQHARALFQSLKVDAAKRKPSLQRRKQMLGETKVCGQKEEDVVVMLSED